MSSADSVSLRSRSRWQRKLCQGWLEHKTQTATGTKYDRLWFLLEDNFIFIFKTDEATKNTQIGSLSIDKQTVFKSESGGSQAGGFKFDLTTGTRKNRFKTRKSSERELWRGYIMGVATGTVPDDLDLLEDQVKTIRDNVMAYHTGQPVGQSTSRVSFISGGSGDSGVGEATSMHSGFSRPSASGSGSGSASGGSGGGPIMKNKFYNEMSPDQVAPSWFFSGCSREKAEEILTRCSDHGNTLMRESTSHMKNGSYVISRRIFDKTTNSYTYEHFEVMRVAGGYKLNVQNEHQPMRCLTDVMDYFKETSGGSTRFMDTNDPYRFGLKDDPEYQRHIRNLDPEPWAWPPPDLEEDYDDAQGAEPRNPGYGASTVSPGILKNVKGPGPKKSVEFNARTCPGSSRRAPQQTTLDDIAHRSNAAAHLREFDHIIDGFDTGNVYQNENPINNPEIDATPNGSISRFSMPLPPTPHQFQQPGGHSYINTGHGNGPALTRSKSSIQSQSPRNVPLHHAQSTPDHRSLLEQNIINKRAQLTKPHSSDTGLGSHVNPKSPESMPVWDNKPTRSVGTPGVSHPAPHGHTTPSVQHSQQPEVQSGVDESNPGGVRNLSSRFEHSTQISPPVVKPQRRGGGRLFDTSNRKSAPVFSLHTESDRLQGQPADDYLHPATAINTNSSQSNASRNVNSTVNSKQFNNSSALGKELLGHSYTNTHQIHDVYDDAAIPGSLPGGQQPQADSAERQTATRFKASFIKKLEGTIGVTQAAHSQSQADHVYEELPIIQPDAVTYANDIIDD